MRLGRRRSSAGHVPISQLHRLEMLLSSGGDVLTQVCVVYLHVQLWTICALRMLPLMRAFAGSTNLFRAVDMYHALTGNWSMAQLSKARMSFAATSVGNMALFAGGYDHSRGVDVVDLYNLSTDTWTTAQLSVGRYLLAATSVGNVALFAGGLGPTGGALLSIHEGLWE